MKRRKAVVIGICVLMVCVIGAWYWWRAREARIAEVLISCSIEDVIARVLTRDGKPVTARLRLRLLEPLLLPPGDYIVRASVGYGLSEDTQFTLDPGSTNHFDLPLDRPEVFRMRLDDATFRYESDEAGQYLFGVAPEALRFSICADSWQTPADVPYKKIAAFPGLERLRAIYETLPHRDVPLVYFQPIAKRDDNSASAPPLESQPLAVLVFREFGFVVAISRDGTVTWGKDLRGSNSGFSLETRTPADLNGDGVSDFVAVSTVSGGLRLVALSGSDGVELWSILLPAVFTDPNRATLHTGPGGNLPSAANFLPIPDVVHIKTVSGSQIAVIGGNDLLFVDAESGHLVSQTELPAAVEAPVVVHDFDHDGSDELLILGPGQSSSSSMTLWGQRGLQWWNLDIPQRLPPAFKNWRQNQWRPWPKLADLNRDGTDDIVVPAVSLSVPERNGPHLIALDGKSGQPIWTSRVFPSCHGVEPTQIGPDTNGDGTPEVFVFSRHQREARDTFSTIYVDCLSGYDGRNLWNSAICQQRNAYRGNLPSIEWTWTDETPGTRLRLGVRLTLPSASVSEMATSLVIQVCPYTGQVLDEQDIRSLFLPKKILRNGDQVVGARVFYFESGTGEKSDVAVIQTSVAPPVWRRAFPLVQVNDLDGDEINDYVEKRLTGLSAVSSTTGQTIWTRPFSNANNRRNERFDYSAEKQPAVLSIMGQGYSAFRRDNAIEDWDIDRDGVGDLLTIEPRNKQGHLALAAVSGKTGRQLWTRPINLTLDALALGGQFVWAVSTDMTQDGIPDIGLAIKTLGDIDQHVTERGWGTLKNIVIALVDGRNGKTRWKRIQSNSAPNVIPLTLVPDKDGDGGPELVYLLGGNAYILGGQSGAEIQEPIPGVFPGWGSIQTASDVGTIGVFVTPANSNVPQNIAAIDLTNWKLLWRHEFAGLWSPSDAIDSIDRKKPTVAVAAGPSHVSLVTEAGVQTTDLNFKRPNRYVPSWLFAVPDRTGDGIDEVALCRLNVEIRDPVNNFEILETIDTAKPKTPFGTFRRLGESGTIVAFEIDPRHSELIDVATNKVIGQLCFTPQIGSFECLRNAAGAPLAVRRYDSEIWPIQFFDADNRKYVEDWLRAGLSKQFKLRNQQGIDPRLYRSLPWESLLNIGDNRERWFEFAGSIAFKSFWIVAVPLIALYYATRQRQFSLRVLLVAPLVVLAAMIGIQMNHTWIYELKTYSHWYLAIIVGVATPVWLLLCRAVNWLIHRQPRRLLFAISAIVVFGLALATAHVVYDQNAVPLIAGEMYSMKGWYWPFLGGLIIAAWLWILGAAVWYVIKQVNHFVQKRISTRRIA